MKHLVVISVLLAAATLLFTIPGCRDRDALLSPGGPSGSLQLSVSFAVEDEALPEPEMAATEKKGKADGKGSSAGLSAAIYAMDVEVYDGSQDVPVSLATGVITINWDDSSFSSVIDAEAGSDRAVAVRAYGSDEAVVYLGLDTGINLVAGEVYSSWITMRSFVPVISGYTRISQDGQIQLSWTQIDNATSYILHESNRANFATYDSLVFTGQNSAVLSGRPGGDRYFRVLARSNYAVGSPSAAVKVQVSSSPVFSIQSPPLTGTTVQSGQPVLFMAQVLQTFQDQINNESIGWLSSLDGFFAAGEIALYSGLSQGDHRITVVYQEDFSLFSFDTVSVTVSSSGNLAPQVTLEYPSDSSSFNQGEAILFLASGVDPEDGSLTSENFYWLSSRDGFFGKGSVLEYDQLSLGDHILTVVGVDETGAAGLDSIDLSVVYSGANTAPKAGIITPLAGSVFAPGDPVLFQGLAEDNEEGLLSGEALTWTSSLDGGLGTGAVLVVSDLSPGDHTLFLTAVDAMNAADLDSVAISVAVGASQPPSAVITLPQDGSIFQLGANIRFIAEGEGEIDEYLWFSSSTGVLGSGRMIESYALPLGSNIVYLAVVDSRGAAGLDSVRVEIVSSGGNQAPQVTISSPFDGTAFDDDHPIYLSAAAFDPEDGALEGTDLSWYESTDGVWVFLDFGEEIFVSSLTVGDHRLKVVAVDHLGAAGLDSVDISVVSSGGSESPSAVIVSPPDGGQYNQGAGILFSAEVTGITEEEAAEGRVWWSSDMAGRFATGVFTVEHGLPLGSQWVYLSAVAETGAAARDSVRVEVISSGGNRSPEVTLVSPESSSSWPGGSSIPFLGLATDPEEGELSGESLSWNSSLAGKFGSGEYLVYSSLPEGTQWVHFVAVDALGAAGSDSVEINVGGGSGNQAPVASIVYPADGLSFAIGTPVLFAGGAADPEEGNLSGEQLQWYSSISGTLGTGDYLIRSDLAEGEHQIILLATDGQGLTGFAEVNITIEPGGNLSPVTVISSPQTGSAFAIGSSVTFTGTASDPEDGVLPGSSLTWISSIDDELGTGASLTTDQLSPGAHNIVLMAKDSRDAGAFDTVSISLSYPPTAEILSPLDGTSFPVGAPIEFSGSANDPEDGVLPSSALLWRSSLEEDPIGVGAIFVIRNLRLGTHQITLIASDQLGLADSVEVTIEVVAVPDTVVSTISVGSAPLRVAVDPLSDIAYLTNSGDNSLSVVDLQSLNETNRIGVGNNPIGLAISQSLGRVYIANTSGNNISVVEGNSVAQTIPVSFQPVGVAVNHDESLVFVSNSNAASISVISTTESSVVHTIAGVGNSPEDLLIPPTGNLLYVSNYGNVSDTSEDEVAAINLNDYTISRIPVGDKPMGLASLADGSLVFVTNSGSNTVSIIRTSDLQVLTDVSVGLVPTDCAVSPDDNQLYVVNSGSGDISVVDISSKTVIEVIPDVGQQPYGIAIYDDPVEDRVLALVTDRDTGNLVILLVR
jgi:YVTN family beta-propeller protein